MISTRNSILLLFAAAPLFCEGPGAVAKSMPPAAFDIVCKEDADCTVSNILQDHDHCCIGCGFEALNKKADAFRKKWRNKNCNQTGLENCVIYECAIENAVSVACEKRRCVLKKAHVKNKRDSIEKLRWVEEADPIIDVKQAIKIRDFRLLAVRGYTVFLPGVSTERQSEYQKKHAVQIIEGTTDAPVSEEHNRLNLLAIRYAEKYNDHSLGHGHFIIGQTISEAIHTVSST